jgi:hypothetical protein
MGATGFTTRAAGTTIGEAFRAAVDQAYYWHGHGGYTGTIAEKNECVEYDLPVLPPVTDDDAPAWMSDIVQRYANALNIDPRWDTEDSEYAVIRQGVKDRNYLVERIGARLFENMLLVYENKWGPAIAFRVNTEEWAFMGTASC